MKMIQRFNAESLSSTIMTKIGLVILLSLFSLGQLRANSYSENTKLSLQFKKARLESVLNEIENQSEFRFVFNEKDLNLTRLVDVSLKNASVEIILDELFKDTDLTYKVIDRQIVIAPDSNFSKLWDMQQPSKVSGKVVDENGEGIPGTTIVIKGTTVGTITDFNGNFSLDVPENGKVIIFSFIGKRMQEVEIAGQSVFNIILETETVGLEEVIAIGYGTIRKSDLTGSVSSISAKDFGDRSGTSIGGLLQGKVSGVEITQGKIRVRGVTTINNTDPLFVIDGFIGGDMETVHPNDIESIEVLKDASATAIYGARGANGVILVTTKKGKAGAPRVEFSSYFGVASPAKQMEILNASQYMDLVRDIEINGGTTTAELGAFTKIFNPDGTPNDYSTTTRTDWQDKMHNIATTEEYALSIRGGSDKSSYSVSTSYNNSSSIRGNENWKNFKFGVSGDWKVFNDKLKISENFRIQHYNNSGMDVDLLHGLRVPPYLPIYDENALGGYAFVTTTDDLTDADNPLTEINLTDRYTKGISLMAQLGAELEITDGLTFNTSVGVTGSTETYNTYVMPRQSGNLVFPDSEMRERMEFWYSPKIENYLTFKKIYGVHNITAMIGNTYEHGSYGRLMEIYGKGFINDNVRNVTKADQQTISNNNGTQLAYISYFGRINYILMNKYMMTVNFRADGSDKFAPASRWGYFPSVALGWKLHEEAFLKDNTVISQLKLRTSYGITGNDAIGQYRYFSNVHSDPTYAFPSHGLTTVNFNGATINSLASPIIKWEETKNTSIGVDLGLFNNKIELNVDYFHKDTYDVLFAVPQPPSLGMGLNSGGGNAIVNAASVLNKGIEFNLRYKSQIDDFKYNVQANATFVKNEVTGLGSGEPYNDGTFGYYSTNRTEIGEPIGYFYGFNMDKVYAAQSQVDTDNQAARAAAKTANPELTNDELANIYYQSAETKAGDIRFFDLDGNGAVTDDDRTNLGSPIPKVSYGISTAASYKNFDFFMTWTGVAGNKILYEYGYWLEGMIRPFNSSTTVLNRWRSEAEPGNGMVPRAVKTDPSKNLRMSDRFIYNGSYARMKQISVGYTIPQSFLLKTFRGNISNVRFYISGDNLITFTKYPGYNPEIGGDNTKRGIDDGVNPAARTYRLGVSVSF